MTRNNTRLSPGRSIASFGQSLVLFEDLEQYTLCMLAYEAEILPHLFSSVCTHDIHDKFDTEEGNVQSLKEHRQTIEFHVLHLPIYRKVRRRAVIFCRIARSGNANHCR